jgi:hypothetical protein
MSHLSQVTAEALANARVAVAGTAPLHQPEKDRILLSFDDQPYYVVCLSDRERIRIEAAIEIAYGVNIAENTESEFKLLHEKFVA